MSAENPVPTPNTPPAAEPPAGPPPRPVPTGTRFGSRPFRGDGPDRGPRGGDRPRSDTAPQTEFLAKNFGSVKPNKRDLDKSIEDELNAAMAGAGDLAALEAPAPNPSAKKVGGKKKGRIVGIHGKDVFVDVPGGRGQGVLPIQQFEAAPPQIGDEVEFDIERYDAANGLLLLTREGATQQVSDWSSVAYGMVVEVKLNDMNKNKSGFQVEVNGIRGFMPLGQLDMYRVEQPETLVGQKLKVMVVEVNAEERNLIVSRRAVQEKEREQKAVEFWKTVAEGQVLKGIVKSIKPFGAFVDLGGADGLIPISELSWSRVETVESVLSVNQLVEVKVMRLDTEARKIGLSLKVLHGNPWNDFAAQHRPGARVTGKVTRVMDFGAFVELVPGIEGLIHVSELSTQRVRRPADVVTVGQAVVVQILNIETDVRRIALSLKAIATEAEAAAAEEAFKEKNADLIAANEKMANRPANPNLRGGIGGDKPLFGLPPA